jgi:hypothetical protein
MAEIITPTYVGSLSLITPAASPNTQPSPATWLVVLSGIAVADFTGVSGTEYTILVLPDVTGPINSAVDQYGAPQPAGNTWYLNLEQWAPYAAVGSIFDEDRGTDGGFDVRTWLPNPFTTVTDATTGLRMNQIFTGFQVGITARESGPITYRLPYNFTLLAQIASTP